MKHQKRQLETMTLGEIAAQIPGATGVFRHYDLDFCCAGNINFSKAVEKKGLDPQAITQALETLIQTPPAANSAPSAEADDKTLTEYIVKRFHDAHRQQFPELIRLATRVEQVHAAKEACPKDLARHLTQMFEEISLHMEKEEKILFPMLCRGERTTAAAPIAMMESEHVSHGKALETIHQITHNGALPEDACHTWRALYQGLSQLEEDLIQHIHLENNILFAR